ncbi:DUF4112 domain-containing protein [Halostella sp. PRR32]|uniref:DUF4112 domain-containing protein n=1 Tax=Halostella sp. PRR32 TaxID=3098147 RepID=UPI002B1E3C2C|nr:DUF4112 domain-containing protein [Halostella sp. PRR32]
MAQFDFDDPTAGLSSDADRTLVGDEGAAIQRMRAVSTVLDDAIRVPGTDFRVGLDPLVGILPVAGDSVMFVVSMYIVLEAANLGVPAPVVARMVANIAIDAVVGSVPLLGTLFDAAWKANRRNVRLVEEHVDAV